MGDFHKKYLLIFSIEIFSVAFAGQVWEGDNQDENFVTPHYQVDIKTFPEPA